MIITKFNSDIALYDSLSNNTNYISYTFDDDYIYFLKNSYGDIIRYNTITEEISSFSLSSSNIYSIFLYKEQIYGFSGYKPKKFINDTVLYIKNNNLLVQESFNKQLSVIHLSSSSEIRDFMIDDDNNYYVIHARNKISKFTKERIPLYSVTINPTISTAFNQFGIIPNDEVGLISLDFVREYTSAGLSSYPIVLGNIKNGIPSLSSKQLFLGKIDESVVNTRNQNDQYISNVSFIPLTAEYTYYGDSKKINYNLSNYDFLKNKYLEKNEIVFKIYLKNVYNNRDISKISIPVSTDFFKTEYHHFTIRMDGLEGFISVFCDGREIKTVKIDKGKYIFQNIFEDNINVGNTYFHNNVSLDQFLNQKQYYYVNNCKLKQFKIYNKALSDNQISFLVYNGIQMDDLILSLPSDQRNELDGIDRQFKLDITGNKSNNINIIIKNSEITNVNLQNKFKSILSEKLKKILPINITINNIEFKNAN